MSAHLYFAEITAHGSKQLEYISPGSTSPVWYVLIIQSNVESGPKMIQFNIQFKIDFELFIQSKNSFKS